MEKIMLVLVVGLISSVFALASVGAAEVRQPKFVQTCAQTGLEKLLEQAQADGSTLQEETLSVCGVDSRWYNPSKYVWYCATAVSEDGSDVNLKKMVQYSQNLVTSPPTSLQDQLLILRSVLWTISIQRNWGQWLSTIQLSTCSRAH